jgi:hypothetical protein
MEPFNDSSLLRDQKREAATIEEEKLCSVLQCARAIAEKYNGKRFVKEFNTVLMKS